MKILIIEDEPNNMMLMTIILKKYGHEPIEAVTGEEGIEKAAFRPDLILMDIRLPGIDGLETTQNRKMGTMPDVPIIAVTAHAMADELESIKAGCNGCLEKPFIR